VKPAGPLVLALALVEKALSGWNPWPGNWPFVPQYLYVWQLADKRVQCRIDHPFYAGFAKTVCNCHFLEGE
jgi:hypothetical protein